MWEVKVKPGQRVEQGQALMVLEAMKMEYPVAADITGTIAEVHVESNTLAQQGDVLISIAIEA